MTREEMDETIKDAIRDAIMEIEEEDDNDLDADYAWTVGGRITEARHYEVTTNDDLEKVPVGGRFTATRRQLLQWNQEWARFYSGDDDSEDEVEDTQELPEPQAETEASDRVFSE